MKLAKARGEQKNIEENQKSSIMSSEVTAKAKQIQSEIDGLEAESEKMGLQRLKIKVGSENQVGILSSIGGDFDFDYIDVRYDSSTGLYIFEGQGQWKNRNWYNDNGCSPLCVNYSTKNVGGEDGFALFSLHRDISIFNQRYYTLKSDFATAIEWTNTASTNVGARGYGWKWQDNIYFNPNGAEFNSARQFGWYYFAYSDGKPSSGSVVSFKASTSHTWDTTSVSGISLAPWSIGFAWNTGSSHWEKETQINVFY
ncbi:hypothetical protein [Paenibacillus sp. N3.4]|uniref:hypothetical protein n=1 Tax=Paenibacillus sp. N3.4 TaxID=2603222 RepID=UPI0011C7B6F7|nr:hypothetical protein [Paenibacillus sp. N3.4]TXK73192.1 hypothetical protein FU659_30885 [Paenibacillus sp. N3.4]